MELLSIHRYLGALAIITVFAVFAKVMDITLHRIFRFIGARFEFEFDDATVAPIRKPIQAVIFLAGCWLALLWGAPKTDSGFFFLPAVKSILILMIGYHLNKTMKGSCKGWCTARPRWEEHIHFMENFGRAGLFIFGIVVMLHVWAVDTTPFLASAGIVSIAIAIAAKDTVANLFGGINLFLDKPFVRGDYIVLDSGERGLVIDIGLRSTLIRTRDDEQISIPNAIMSNTKVINESAPEPRFRIHIRVGVAFGSDIDEVEATLLDVAHGNPSLATSPAAKVRFRRFDESSLAFELLCCAKNPGDRGRIIHELNRSIYQEFGRRDICIPFPQREMYVHNLAGETKNNRPAMSLQCLEYPLCICDAPRKGLTVSDQKYQVAGLIGFILSGFFFLVSSLKAGDYTSILGCIVWIFSCIIWLIPLLKKKSK